MKVLPIILFVVGAVFLRNSPKEMRPVVSQNETSLDSNKVRLDGAYSLYDTSKGNDEIEAFKRYILIDPILFLKSGDFIQSSNCRWVDTDIADEVRSENQKFDYGKYYINGNEIVLEGTFTFYTRGMERRQYKAKYTGYFDKTWDTLYLKLGEPYPPINLKFNNRLLARLKSGGYEKYVFKAVSEEKSDINDAMLEQIKKNKPRK